MNGAIGKDTLWVEVSDERFTEAVQRSFKRVGEPRVVTTVDLGDGPRAVRALVLDAAGAVTTATAHACVVEDSGSGLVWLVYGGAAGLSIGGGDVPRADEGEFDAFLLVERDALVFAD